MPSCREYKSAVDPTCSDSRCCKVSARVAEQLGKEETTGLGWQGRVVATLERFSETIRLRSFGACLRGSSFYKRELISIKKRKYSIIIII